MEEEIIYKRPDGKDCKAYYVSPISGETAPGIVVLQEWWGLNDQIKGVFRTSTEVGSPRKRQKRRT